MIATLRSWRDAMAFVVRQQRGVRAIVARRHHPLTTAAGAFAADLYLRTDLASPVRARGTMLVIHGMSMLGRRDPRIEALCRALAASGFAAIAPEYDEIRDLRIDVRSVDAMAATMAAIGGDAHLCPGGRFAVVTASFSAGMALLAAVRSQSATHVAALCLVGGFAEVDSVLAYVMGEQHADDYGRLVVLRNFLPHVMPVAPAIVAALDVAIADNALARSEPHLPHVVAQMDDPDRALLMRLLHCARTRTALLEQILIRVPALRTQLNVLHYADRLTAPVFLLHGRSDDVIPASQSGLLHRHLRRHGRPSRLVVTPLVSHGDAAVSLRHMFDVVVLLRGFAYFFRHAHATAACHMDRYQP